MDWETEVKKLHVLRHNELILSKTGHCWLLFVYVCQNLMTWYFKLLRNNDPLSCLYFTFICYDLNDKSNFKNNQSSYFKRPIRFQSHRVNQIYPYILKTQWFYAIDLVSINYVLTCKNKVQPISYKIPKYIFANICLG